MHDNTFRLGLPGDPATEEDRDSWRSASARFLKRAREDDDDSKVVADARAPAKAQRISSYRHCLASDALLQSGLPDGIALFLPKPEDDDQSMLDLWTWVNAEDSGPIPWAARQFLQRHLMLRQVAIRDYYHVVWRAILGGVSGAGLRGTLYMASVGHSLAHGPWEGAAWFQNLADAAKDYWQHSRGKCPLFTALVPRLMKDLGRAGEVVDDSVLNELKALVFDQPFLEVRGPRDQMSRWLTPPGGRE